MALTECPNGPERVHVIATQHLDVAWLWARAPYGEELMRQCFERAIEMIEADPTGSFVFSRSTAWSFRVVHIHPFVDGNGRASRLLSTLCLYRTGYDFKHLFSISEFYDRDRAAFYAAIQGVRDNGMDLTGWLDHFTTGLATQMDEVKERGTNETNLRQLATSARESLDSFKGQKGQQRHKPDVPFVPWVLCRRSFA
jgi:Fic family protein